MLLTSWGLLCVAQQLHQNLTPSGLVPPGPIVTEDVAWPSSAAHTTVHLQQGTTLCADTHVQT